ncbi:DUF3299 domain-containing protein [Marinobacter bohaiensis]|uniref:DUF3299 domain-containing protein n=1 Tax=Marinobacter bohaiensis TaxID=2201898 RepID=UPI000DAEBA6F|nr:DUF3299 domain-containing protein [Marinobacter bohaiensis]
MLRAFCSLVVALLLAVGQPVSAEEAWPEVDWLDLMPAEDLALLENLPEIEHQGNGPVTLPDEIMTGRTVPEYDHRRVRIPGFVVPLKVDNDQRIYEFFLVPYYGACIHVPPPPPNQIIHVTYEEGFQVQALYDPFWVKGVLRIEETETEVGDSSYAMDALEIVPYEG